MTTLNQGPCIVAVATPPGKGGVGIVRLSGAGAKEILQALVPQWPPQWPSHTLRLSRIFDAPGQLVDESLVVFMPGPRSYTGEDVVEFQCHGGPVILSRVLDAALAHGARVAAPGEFTQRAFLQGRLDLTQAEAVADLIQATSAAAHKLAIEHLEGSLGQAIRAHLERLVEAMMLIESAIDFSHEEHVYQIEFDEVERRLLTVREALVGLLSRFDQGRRQREGVRIVVAGPTNAGKSTLFNALHGTSRAIVTDIEGTTRDFLEEEIVLGGVSCRLIDTAGLRQTTDRVEEIGIARSRALAAQADLLCWVIDQSVPMRQDVRAELLAPKDDTPVILVLNKADLPCGLTPEDLELCATFPHQVSTALGPPQAPPAGLKTLEHLLLEHAISLTSGEGVLLSRTRHRQSVKAALEAIERGLEALNLGAGHELLAIDVREALDALGEIVGHVSRDDVLNRIFGEFCVGK